MNRVVIGVGSNIAPRRHIRLARAALAAEQRLLAASRFVRTRPLGVTAQPHFLNGALLVETPLSRRAFAAYLKRIERRLGRRRTTPRDGPRTIDLDVVAWNGAIVDADFHARAFLRRAAREVCPGLAGGRRARKALAPARRRC